MLSTLGQIGRLGLAHSGSDGFGYVTRSMKELPLQGKKADFNKPIRVETVRLRR